MSETDGSLTAHLAQHPRLMGVLFTMFLLLSQAGTAVAGNSGAVSGI